MELNETAPVVAQETTKLTSLQLGVIVAILWIGVVILIIGLYWLSKKYPTRKGKIDPVYKGIFLILIVMLAHITVIAVGALPQDSLENNLYLYGIAIVVAIIFYSIVSFYQKRVIPSYKLWKNYVLPEIKRFWNAEPYKGIGYGKAMTFYQVIEGTQKTKYLTEEQAQEAEKVQVFMGKVFFATIFEYIAVANKKTGEILRLQEKPPLSQKQELTTREFISSQKQPLEEYGTKEEEIEVRK